MPSSGEILVTLLVVFILFGGKGLKDVARTMGKWSRKIQNASREFQRELNLDEIRRDMDDDSPPKAPYPSLRRPENPDKKDPSPEGTPGKSDLSG